MSGDKNGRVTTREFYKALMELRKELSAYHVEVVKLNGRVNNNSKTLSAYNKGVWLFGSTGLLWVLYEVFTLVVAK